MFYVSSPSQPISASHNKHLKIHRLMCPSTELLETSLFHSIKIDLVVSCLETKVVNEPVLKRYATPSLPCCSCFSHGESRWHIGQLQPVPQTGISVF